jgi:hypothetical protein
METGDAHKVGIRGMDEEKPRMGKIPGPVCGRQVLSIHLSGIGIEPAHGINKIQDRTNPLSGVGPQQKPDEPYPKRDKVKIPRYPPGAKGYRGIQGMIHGGKGNQSGKEGGFVLEKEEMVKDGFNAPDSRAPQCWIGGYFKQGKPQGFFCNAVRHTTPYKGMLQRSILPGYCHPCQGKSHVPESPGKI